ncbi:hypothetical protein AVEN_165325-1 [Araneus ventricosus]|uniref:Uncharacterized protein n=1 Tax=Araneus ventricosus TaxID=182803 RepID=A0A4Y2AVH3_ARAVE|nr:hypothetical protein AVEN_165325-1 [Araneus ventricosus]
MRQEMGTMSAPPDRDIYIINEVTAPPKNDQPIDLRVRSVIQRDNNNNNYRERQTFRERPGKNLILASLLTKTSQPTQIQHNLSPQTYSFPNVEQNARNRGRSLTSRDIYLNVIPAYYGIPQPQFQGENKQSIVEKLNIKRELTDEFSDHKSWNINVCRDQSSTSTSSAIHNINSPSTSFRSVAPGIEIGVRSNYQNDKEIVPKYWKYHSKYSNLPSTSRTVPERVVQNQRNNNFDQYSIIRERLTSNTIIQPPQSSFNNLDTKSSHLYRLLQQRSTEHTTQSLKRKSSYSIDTTQNDTTKNKTLRCLLSAGKRSPTTNANHFQGPSFYQQGQMEYRTIIKTEPPDEDDEIQITYQQPMHARYHQNVNTPSQVIYYPEVARTAPPNVLKGLLVSNCKTAPPTPRLRNILPRPGNMPLATQEPSRPTSVLVVPRAPSTSSPMHLSTLTQSRPSTALPTTRPPSVLPVTRPQSILQASGPTNILSSSGPPSSGSPGSESTSSGSTDSGVFSDSLTDDRRRINRVMSGRHVKTGTGASITTLRLLRQMIIDRKNKTDRKL